MGKSLSYHQDESTELQSTSNTHFNELFSLFPNPPAIHFNKSLLINNQTETDIISSFLNTSLLSNPQIPNPPLITNNPNNNTTTPNHNTIPFTSITPPPHDLSLIPSLDLGLRLGNNNSKCQQSDEESISTITEESSPLSSFQEEPITTPSINADTNIHQIYKFKETINIGHFSTVRIGLKKTNPYATKLFAIKSISKKHLTHHSITLLLKELNILSSLDHPNIINVYETYNDKFHIHIIMELCQGKDIFTTTSTLNPPLTETQIAFITMKLLHAVAYCHNKGIAHLNLKPQNVLFTSLSRESEIKLINFGLSKKYISNALQTQTQFDTSQDIIKTSSCDIWSIGVIAYSLLINEPIILNYKYNGDILCHKAFKCKCISQEAISFIKWCLCKQPHKRPTAVEALKHEWFHVKLTSVYNSILVNKNIMHTIYNYKPCCTFIKYVLMYCVRLIGDEEIKVYRDMFYAIDYKCDGVVDEDEIEKAFVLNGIDVTYDGVKRVLSASLEERNKQKLNYSEFIMVCLELREGVREDKVEKAFKFFDVNCSGVIEEEDVYKAVGKLKKEVNENEVGKMIKEVKKGVMQKEITFEEFTEMFRCWWDNKTSEKNYNEI